MVDVPSAQVRAARGLWNKGQRADALRLFDDAIRREPNNVRTYVMAARAYAEKYDFVHMEEVFEKLIRRAPRHPGVHHYIGETYGLLKLPDRAIASYERASRLPGAGPTTWMELASLYERAHRLDEAEELIERTMAADFEGAVCVACQGTDTTPARSARRGGSDVSQSYRAVTAGLRIGLPGLGRVRADER